MGYYSRSIEPSPDKHPIRFQEASASKEGRVLNPFLQILLGSIPFGKLAVISAESHVMV